MNNGDYWKARMSALSDGLYEKSEKYYKDVRRQYDKAMHDIERDISVWYQRIADNNDISYAAAKELLKKNELKEFKWLVDDYIKAGEENAVNKKWIKELENASARYHISRLEAMKIQIRQRAELAAAQFGSGLKDFLGEAYSDQYYHTAFEIMRGIGIGHNLARIDDRTLDTVLKKPWAQDGKVFSDRIWEDKERLVNNLHTELTQGLIRGDPPQRMIDNLSKRMGVSRSNAGRLIMTETAAISARATQDSYKELDVEEFQVLETLDSRTCMICRDMDGRHFPMSDYKIGVTVPPFHPRCRGTTIPYFDDEFTENEMRAARDENDEGYVLVPAGMTYKDWKKIFVDGRDKFGFDAVHNGIGVLYKKKNEQDTSEESFDIRGGTKKLKEAMDKEEYKEYIKRLTSNGNLSLQKIYADYADKISEIQYSANNGYYKPSEDLLVFSYPKQKYLDNGKDKYSTLAHEYGHYFDHVVNSKNLNYNEINTLNSYIVIGDGRIKLFKQVLSSSDEFLSALRKDKEILREQLSDIKDDLLSTDASAGVQDAVSGMFAGAYGKDVRWGHKDEYYNRLYNNVKSFKRHNELKKAYKELSLDASSQVKVKSICRNYETASEMWANIMSAETCGGAELEYVKKYLPNSYQAFLEIIGKVE